MTNIPSRIYIHKGSGVAEAAILIVPIAHSIPARYNLMNLIFENDKAAARINMNIPEKKASPDT